MENMEFGNKKHYCPQCGISFYRPYRLVQHLLLHNNIKAFACEVNGCNKSYSNRSHLDRHVNSVHLKANNDVVYSCPTCMKVYANRQNLKRHINMQHGTRTTFSCDHCKLDFNKKNQLSAHMFKHTGIKSFSCTLCNQEFVTLYEKKKHQTSHKIYTCVDCKAEFNQWSKYQKHRKEHIPTDFICNECGRHFNKRLHIVRHVKTHTSARTFPCPYNNCERSYSRNSNLKQHILVKHMKMLYECQICGAQLSSKARLNYHVVKHYSPETIITEAKTKATGRKERKDVGSIKKPMALKLAGIEKLPGTNVNNKVPKPKVNYEIPETTLNKEVINDNAKINECIGEEIEIVPDIKFITTVDVERQVQECQEI